MKKKTKEIIVYNDLCLKCKHDCKQLKVTELLTCPNFEWKEEQLEIKFSSFKTRKK